MGTIMLRLITCYWLVEEARLSDALRFTAKNIVVSGN